MRNKTYIFILVCSLFLAACGTQKVAVESPKPKIEKKSTWKTCVIRDAKAVVNTSGQRLSATVTMQTVRDSLLIINIMPKLGIELARLEATPTEVMAFDKFHNRYVATTYKELNSRLKPKISWKQLQQICSAELPGGKNKAHLEYSIGKDTVRIDITYTPRKINVPVKMNRLNTKKYKKTDIRRL